MENKSKELEVAMQAALEAGKIVEKHFETELIHEVKDDKSIVTIADKESEEIIKKIILTAFPQHSILGEETGLTQNGNDYVWHIDPIDGTRNFANGIPLFSVSIALENKGEIVIGVIYNPATKTIFYAEKGKGAYCNGSRIFVSKNDESHSIITASGNKSKEDKKFLLDFYYHIQQGAIKMRYFGCTALDLAYVAKGSTEATIQLGWSTYDYAAGTILVQEAGGVITTFNGEKWKFPDAYFIASNGVFHDLLISEVQKQKAKLNLV